MFDAGDDTPDYLVLISAVELIFLTEKNIFSICCNSTTGAHPTLILIWLVVLKLVCMRIQKERLAKFILYILI